MDIKSKRFGVIALLTFVILFLMNYIGSTYDDKLSRALMTAGAGVISLSIAMWYLNRKKKDDHYDEFD